MSDSISSRHESELGGRFLPFGEAEPVEVTVVVSPDTAHRTAIQHAAWMLVNLLSRQQGIVSRIGFICPSGVAQAGRIIPLARGTLDFRAGIIAGSEQIGVVPIAPDEALGRRLVVGTASQSESGELYVTGNGWCGGVSTTPTDIIAHESELPFGPYIAACLAAGEVFKAARLKPGTYQCVQSIFYSAWTRRSSKSYIAAGPIALSHMLDIALAGVGAVGCAFLHVLDCCPGVSGKVLLADNDEKGLEASNLNRYALFGMESVGRKKATEAARLLADSPIELDPYDQPMESLSPFPMIVVSAVDTNQSRAAIQNKYPSQIVSASTRDLRLEVLRCGPPGIGACLRCYNPPPLGTSDAEIALEIKNRSDGEVAAYAEAAGVTVADVRQWAASQKCGMAGEAVLRQFREFEPQPHGFAVGFVSVMAGTLLASELIICDSDLPDVIRTGNRSVFQFWSPLASTNGPTVYVRDPQCPMCRPETPAVRIWNERFHRLQFSTIK